MHNNPPVKYVKLVPIGTISYGFMNECQVRILTESCEIADVAL